MEKNTALEEVRTTTKARDESEYSVTEAVVTAKLDGKATWQEIADALGMASKQAAQARYGSYVRAEESGRKWAAENPERHAAAVQKGKDAAAAALKEIQDRVWNAATEDHAQHVEAAAIFLDGTAPAKPQRQRKPNATQTQRGYTDDRPEFVLRSAGFIDGVAQPGTGKGPHQCPRCGITNHKGNTDTVRAYFDCKPTKYDPQDIATYLTTTGLRK
jgi:hypothetical protein